MQKDFHYYCTAVLARAAGCVPQDALTIAYAAQYVDDSTENEPIRVGDVIFDPVRTAHMGLKAFDWSTQKRVYLPFHFIPPGRVRTSDDLYPTTPNAPFALDVLERACEELPGKLRLCRIGVALHTLADTWAHQGFSGRHHDENDVERIHHHDGRDWKYLLIENIYLDALPKIGHTEAGYYPDQPFLRWKYLGGPDRNEIERDNTAEFLIAAESIYRLLRDVDKSRSQRPIPWEDVRPKVRDLLADREPDLGKRCGKWKRKFQSLFDDQPLQYDHLQWRREALQPKSKRDIEWDRLKPGDFESLKFAMTPGFYESSWVDFHRAALRQRHYVLENLY